MTLFSLLLFSCNVFAQETVSNDETIVFLFRHAEARTYETMADTPNPELNNAGADRAELLKRTLLSAGITEIYSTQLNRTQQTAQPLANALGLEVRPYDPRDLQGFANELRQKNGRIAISGHSNTTPELVRLLGGDPGEPLNEKTHFDRIYMLIINEGSATQTILLKYGANYD